MFLLYCARYNILNRSHEQIIFYKLIFPTRFHNNYGNVSLRLNFLFCFRDMNAAWRYAPILARNHNTRTRPRNTRQTVMTFSIRHY